MRKTLERAVVGWAMLWMGFVVPAVEAAKADKPTRTAKAGKGEKATVDVAAQRDADRAAVIDGVKEIVFPGVPGALALFGETAFPIAVAVSEKTPAPLIAGARLGQGRVVAFGHGGYFGKELAGQGDSLKLLKNAIVWASGKPESEVRAAVHENRELAETLRGTGLAIAEYKGHRIGGPKQTNVALVNLDRASDSEIKALTKFVEDGGGLLTVSAGWVYTGYVAKAGEPLRDAPQNRLFSRAGIAWAADTVDNPASGSLLPVAQEVSAYLNASVALDVIEKALEKERPTGTKDARPEDDRIALRALELAASSCPADDTLFMPRVETIVTKHAAAIPKLGESKSIQARDILPWSLMTLQTAYYNNVPVDRLKAPATAAAFPGAVTRSQKRETGELQIDPSIPGWHSTGFYAPPGEPVEVRVTGKTDAQLSVRIGCHKDSLWGKDKWSRPPSIDRVFPMTAARLTVGNAYGGLIYIDVKPAKESSGSKATPLKVEITGAAPAPYFVLGKTTDQEWRESIRNHPAPWAELATDRVIITVPSETIRKLDLPTQLMTQWNRILDGVADLAAIPHERNRPERYVADVQISAGYMHSGYPIMTHLDAAPRMVDYGRLSTVGEWGLYHEVGHNHQDPMWTFEGTGEVTCNLFALYLLDTLTPGAPYHDAMAAEKQKANEAKYIAGGRKFEDWKSDPFLALIMYGQLAKGFGWEPYKKVFAEYQTIPASERPKTEEQKHDQWMVRFSKAVGKNLGPFFQHWGIPTSQAARDAIKDLPEWMP